MQFLIAARCSKDHSVLMNTTTMMPITFTIVCGNLTLAGMPRMEAIAKAQDLAAKQRVVHIFSIRDGEVRWLASYGPPGSLASEDDAERARIMLQATNGPTKG